MKTKYLTKNSLLIKRRSMSELSEKLKCFFKRTNNCSVCRHISEHGTSSPYWKELAEASKAHGNNWQQILEAGAITDVPNFFAKEGKIHAYVKVNHLDLPRILIIEKQPPSTLIELESSANERNNLVERQTRQSLKPFDHISLHRCSIGSCCSNVNYVQPESRCSYWYRHCCSCYLYSHHAIVIHKIRQTEDKADCKDDVYQLKETAAATNIYADEKANEDQLQFSSQAGGSDKYHIFEYTGNIYCCGKTFLRPQFVNENAVDPCFLCCCKCYASNTTNRNLDGDNYDVVFYKNNQFSATDMLETIADVHEDTACCVCDRCCSNYSYTGYDCLLNNCEHLATKSRIGIGKSAQVNKCREYFCVYVAKTVHVWLLRLLLLAMVFLKASQYNISFSWQVDAIIYAIMFTLAFLAQLTITMNIVEEQHNFGNELLHLVKWKHGGVCFLRLAALFITLLATLGNVTCRVSS